MKGKLSLAIAFVLAVTVVMLLSSTATADEYAGWDDIREASYRWSW
jgi:ABC-type cobalt transport system substrate-binding protein